LKVQEYIKSVLFSVVNSAVNKTLELPAFAAERRAAALCSCGAIAARSPASAAVDRYLLHARTAVSSKPLHAAAAVE